MTGTIPELFTIFDFLKHWKAQRGIKMSTTTSAKSPRSSISGSMASQLSAKSSPSKNRIERQTNFKVVIRVRPPLHR